MDKTDKTCTRCGLAKPITEFHRGWSYRGGHNARCKQCRAELSAAEYQRASHTFKARSISWAKRNWKRVLALAEKRRRANGISPRLFYATDEERRAAQAANKKRYALHHPDRVRVSKRTYALHNPEKVKAVLANNKARRRNAPGELTATEWKAILFFYGRRCAHCGISESERPLSVDHFIPIARGGEHSWRNVWPLCFPCNLAKRDNVPAESVPPHVEILCRNGTFDG